MLTMLATSSLAQLVGCVSVRRLKSSLIVPGIQHMCLSATELGPSTQLYMDSLGPFSANANLSPSPNAAPIMSMPLVQGMGMSTAIYRGCTPVVQSSVFFRNFSYSGTINSGVTEKYKVTLEEGFQWVIYRTADHSVTQSVRPMSHISNSTIKGDPGFHGFIQIAKLPPGVSDAAYDVSAGAYAISGGITAVQDGSTIKYAFNWTKAGLSKPLLMFALPHHVQSFDSMMNQYVSNIQLWTITKGKATAVISDRWVMVEHIYSNLNFAPYDIQRGSITNISPSLKSLIAQVGAAEVQQDVRSQSVLDSMYFSGKGLGKFAMMIYVLHDIVNRPDLAATGLSKLKDAIAVFINNTQPHPLVYEQSWKGVVSTAGMGGDPGVDFGNSFYNDHHFHYGYFVYTAAVIGYLDPAWLSNQKNRNWINMLVRDFGNPGQDDYFPFSRSFDWYNGHSWVSITTIHAQISSNVSSGKRSI
jgi:endo-1,3(4)-beta-glucanase